MFRRPMDRVYRRRRDIQQLTQESLLPLWLDQQTLLSSRNKRMDQGSPSPSNLLFHLNISAPSYGNSYGDSLSLGQSNTGYKNSYGQSESQGKSNTSGSSAGKSDVTSFFAPLRSIPSSNPLLLGTILVVILITGSLQGTLGVQPTGPRPTGSGKLGMAGPLYW